ncbi:AAA family ATPase [Desulfosporosinus nitroreducens]|uniref:AAA family ATPase n=1 Tax=Desulfosporosinus nitroreducens TaxID=2018668 RepID=UPI00207C9AA8|nr:AAA family ATPase [Desulfosporosinus nitroreducens]MCO1602084.1 AAA family ATPase [Desulfosporosinus nitroreducens]
MERIHITGSSGSGTTTLGGALAERLSYQHFDTDNYFWLPTNPPFQKKRELEDRQTLLMTDLDSTDRWILSGSLSGWGDIFIPRFDLVVYLWISKDLRIERLVKRETRRYGKTEIEVGGKMYSAFNDFIQWASDYDNGGLNMRSKAMHEQWMASLNCKVLRLEGNMSVEERVEAVIETIRKN